MQIVTRNDVGSRLRLLRVAAGLTQVELAEHLNVSTQSIGSYERNERVPRDDRKQEIATFFNTDVQTLFYENVHTAS